MPVLKITRVERDVIRDLRWRWIPEQFGDALPFDTREQAQDSVARIQRGMQLLDELGWDNEDPRETFTVTVDASLIGAVRDRIEDYDGEIERLIEHRERDILGDATHAGRPMWTYDYATIDDGLAAVAKGIQRAEDERRVCDGLLIRMTAEAVTA